MNTTTDKNAVNSDESPVYATEIPFETDHLRVLLTPKEHRIIDALRAQDLLGFMNTVLDVDAFDSDKAAAQADELTRAREVISREAKTELRHKLAKQFASIVFGALVKERFVQLDSLFLSNEAPALFEEITDALEDGLALADAVEFNRLFS